MSEKEKSKGKICPEGKAWAKRTFDVYPSAYANLIKHQNIAKTQITLENQKREMVVLFLLEAKVQF